MQLSKGIRFFNRVIGACIYSEGNDNNYQYKSEKAARQGCLDLR